MPDANQIAASQNLTQYLFYFVCVLGVAIGLSAAWFARYMLLPFRDRHFAFLDAQVGFMKVMELTLSEMATDDKSRAKMHEENLKKLSELHRIMVSIQTKLNGGHRVPEPSAG